MNTRPTGIDPPPSREFVIGVPSPKPYSRRDQFRDWWFYVKNFSLGRGSAIQVELDDEVVRNLHEIGWIHKINDEWFTTRKGSRELIEFMKEELDRLDDQRR
jgi:hypothetical protein